MKELGNVVKRVKENPLMFIKKLVFTVPAGILFFITAVLLTFAEVDGKPITVRGYFSICILTYICFIIPINVVIRLFQVATWKINRMGYSAYEKEKKGISYYAKMPVLCLEEREDKRGMFEVKEKGARKESVKKKRGMSTEELRCFALQCNDYVERQETENEEK